MEALQCEKSERCLCAVVLIIYMVPDAPRGQLLLVCGAIVLGMSSRVTRGLLERLGNTDCYLLVDHGTSSHLFKLYGPLACRSAE